MKDEKQSEFYTAEIHQNKKHLEIITAKLSTEQSLLFVIIELLFDTGDNIPLLIPHSDRIILTYEVSEK